MMRKLFFILFILLILTTIKSNAQYFQNLSVGNGLSQPSVMAIGQGYFGANVVRYKRRFKCL